VRVTVSEDAPTFFLAVIGWDKLPIKAQSISEAASLEMVLVLDSSESMAWYKPPPNGEDEYPLGSPSRNPKDCSASDDCHPFAEVKQTAKEFIDTYLYPPYDRVAIVTFNKNAHLINPATGREIPAGSPDTPILTSNIALLDDALVGGDSAGQSAPGLMVYGVGADPYTGSQRAPYDEVHACHLPGYGNPAYPYPDGFTNLTKGQLGPGAFTSPEDAPCRMDVEPGGAFLQLFAPAGGFDPPNKDKLFMQTSNIGEGLRAAAHVFGNPNESLRQEALWVTILLTDGVANIAYEGGQWICPNSERTGDSNYPVCRDPDPLVRHCKSANVGADPSEANYYHCMDQVAPTGFTWPSTWTWPATTNTVNSALYDADDYARDMTDLLHDSAFQG
jgi:hypothetical protein